MLATELLNLRTQLRDAGIIFTYCGYVTEHVLAGVGDALKQKLLIEEPTPRLHAAFLPSSSSRRKTLSATPPRKANSRHPLDAEAAPPSELSYGIMTVSRDGDAS